MHFVIISIWKPTVVRGSESLQQPQTCIRKCLAPAACYCNLLLMAWLELQTTEYFVMQGWPILVLAEILLNPILVQRSIEMQALGHDLL